MSRAFVLGVALTLLSSVLPAAAVGPAPNEQPPQSSLRPTVSTSLRNHTSAPLRDIASNFAATKRTEKVQPHPMHRLPKAKADGAGIGSGSGAGAGGANAPTGVGMPSFDSDFEGLGNDAGVLPPDTNGDVGPDHYMQWINLQFAIYDKDGNEVVGSTPGNALFDGLGGPCETHNDGDPIAQYDHLSDRWLASQFAIFADDGFHQCIAVSTSGDPTDTWNQYDFLISETKINDYPKFGVWPDAYYMSINQFDANTFGWAGQGAVAFERDAMLDGAPAQMVYFDLFDVDPLFGGQQPSDLDGLPPSAGTPNYFVEGDDDAFGFDTDRLSMWEFHVDWDDPLNSTYGVDGQPTGHLDTDPFEADLCGFSRDCIPQPGTSQGLDAISDRLMYRLQYRNFGDHASLVVNQTVDADGEDHAGIRWYELRDSGSGWGIEQQGTYAPDSDHRWMGSAAMDASGDIAIGYSVSSSETFPSIRAAGRLVSDPPGELSQGESEMIAGTGSQTHPAARWGDYSMLAVDPVDQCTYWYTTEYLTSTSPADWQTRIGHFKFPSCTLGPSGTLEGTVTNDDTSDPIEGATVEAGANSTQTDADGHYSFLLPVDTYDMTVTAYGFEQGSQSGVEILEDQTTTVDFSLAPVPPVTVSGTVTDGSGHGWPLYAVIEIDGYPGDPVYTDPVTGQYSVELVQSTDFTFHVNAISGGYDEATRDANYSSGTATEDFALEVDDATCDAPGYDYTVNGIYERFQTEDVPAGWEVTDDAGEGAVWAFDDPGGRGNLTGGSGSFAISDSDHAGFVPIDTTLTSPVIDLSAVAAPILRFNTDYFSLDDTVDVDLSVDGGSNWDNVWTEDSDLRGPETVEIDISATAANDADVMVRFHHYNAFFAWWWQVDNVLVGDEPVCEPVPGGMLVGNVYDQNTDAALDDASVTSDDEPSDTTTSGPTPADDNLDDGFYSLFSSLTGTHDFTASKANYADDTDAVGIVADSVVSHDFAMAAGHLLVSPTTLEVTLELGDTTSSSFSIENDGTAPAEFELGERDHGFDILSHHGPRTIHKTGTFTPYAAVGSGPKGATSIERPIPPPNALPWIDVASYPVEIMDNTADVFDGMVYSVGGFDGGENIADGYVYDPGSDSWSQIASMTEAREKPAAAFVDGLLYVVGGWDNGGNPDPVLEIYDPGSDTWSSGADIPAARAAAVGISLDGLFYVIGGCPSGDSCGATEVFAYDPTGDSWTQLADYPEDISWTHCGAIDGLIYCGGGVSDGGETDATYSYDPGTDAWTALTPMPQTQWGGGYIATGGMLIMSGGITADEITNEGFAYDTASDSWSPIPNSNNILFRGGSACGFYKIGGSPGFFEPNGSVELLPDLNECSAAADVTWLAEDPTTGSLAASESAEITVDFDAGVPEVPQPGTYLADITIKENTPYSVAPVAVTMNVTAPASWGKLEGTIVGLSRCDEPGAPLANASVHVNGVNADFDLKTDADGFYEWWMPADNDPLVLTVSKTGYVGKSRSSVSISPSTITTQNFTLRLDAPCAESAPNALNFTLLQNDSKTKNLTLQNQGGAAGYQFDIDETAFALDPMAPTPALASHAFSSAAEVGPQSVRTLTGGSSASPSPALPPWFGANDIPGGLVRFGHAQCDGDENTLYVVSGVDGGGQISDKLWRFDAASTEWTELSPIPEGGEGPTATCDAGQIHVMGGDGTTRHYVYDIGSDTWSTAAELPRPVWGAAAATWNGLVFLVGGDSDFSFGGTSDEVNVYDVASDTWIGNGSPMPNAAVTPGFVQAGRFLYVVGGWDDGSPDANLAASQRYNLRTDSWRSGAPLGFPRADLALAATDTALYAIGGDEDGGGPFDGSRTAERLAVDEFADGGWTEIDQIPVPLTANNGGFCTTATFGPDTEVWSAGGVDTTVFAITGRMLFRQAVGEFCPTIRSNVRWLSESPVASSVAHDANMTVKVTVDGSKMSVGEHDATLLVATSDPAHPEMRVPVHVTVLARPIAVYLSLASATHVGGVGVRNEDVIIVHDDGSVEKYFDGSDIGMGGLKIDAFALSPSGSPIMSFTSPAGVPGIIGTVDDSDLVRFVPDSLGPDTDGHFVRYFDGSDVGLTTDGEDIDALDIRADGTILISTLGSARVPGAIADDSDVLRFNPTDLGATTSGSWSLRFDGSDVGLTTHDEDLDALGVKAGLLLISTSGTMTVPGLTARNEDASVFHPTQLGTHTQGTWAGILFDGSAFGLADNNVTAVELP